MSGHLYGVGVGPGDPELLTLKAARIIAAAPVIAYPKPELGPSMARTIAADLIADTAVEIPMPTPYRAGERATEVYDRFEPVISEHLEQDQDVVVLCEGDPLFYGSFLYLLERLQGRFPVTVVPGVSAPQACAAQACRPLVWGDVSFSIIPCTLPEDILREKITASESLGLIKVGRHLEKVKDLLSELGRLDQALLVSRASQPEATVEPLKTAESAPYFAMILVSAP
ncbi:MAG: precorrin-2 C(20)-methyltransferase [Magnetospiraceae bacterium]